MAKALEKEKDRRYASAAELAAVIRRHLHDEPIVARPTSTWYQLGKFAKRNKAFVGAVGGAFCILVCAVVVITALLYEVQDEAKRTAEVNRILESILDSAGGFSFDPAPQSPSKLLDDAVSLLQTERISDPDVEATLRFHIGRSYWAAGDVFESSRQLRSALDIWEEIGGDRNEDQILAGKSELAVSLGWLGRGNEAWRMASEAVAAYEKELGPGHKATLEAKSKQIWSVFDVWGYEQGAAVAEEMLEVLAGSSADSSFPVYIPKANLAIGLAWGSGRFEEAQALLEEALTLAEPATHGESPWIGYMQFNLGCVAYDLEDFEKAESRFREADECWRRYWPPD